MAVQRSEQLPTPEQQPTLQAWPKRRLFDVDEYYRMAEAGILRPDERVELIEGEIYTKSSISDRHAFRVTQLTVVLFEQIGDRMRLSVQNPVRLAARVEPEPDFSISRLDSLRPRRYQGTHPRPEDIYFLIEVADTTVAFDLGAKADLYARYGVPELWVLDLPADRVVIHREPTPDGYASVEALSRGASVSPLAFSDVSFAVDDLLGAPQAADSAPDDDVDDEEVDQQ